MDFKITSDKIANPLLVALLKKLTESFSRMGREYYVIGATARDIIIGQLIGITSGRKTKDLDIAIAIPNWNAFEEIKTTLITDGFTKSKDMHQRFYYGEYELDIVPYGVAKEDDNIYWPPEEEIAMSVKGFDEVLSESIAVNINDEFTIKIASLHGLFILKFNAWMDRNIKTSKDAEDMSFILSNYFMANLERNVYPEVYDWKSFDEYIAGAYWLANDLIRLLTKEQIAYYKNCIDIELEKGEDSRLINQIIEHCYGMSFDTIRDAWRTIASVFQKKIEDGTSNL